MNIYKVRSHYRNNVLIPKLVIETEEITKAEKNGLKKILSLPSMYLDRVYIYRNSYCCCSKNRKKTIVVHWIAIGSCRIYKQVNNIKEWHKDNGNLACFEIQARYSSRKVVTQRYDC